MKRRTKSKTQRRGTKDRSKSSKRKRPIVKARVKTKPSRRAKRSRRLKISSYGVPRRGMSKTFGQFVEPVGKRNGGSVYAIVELDFVYGRRHNRFSIPLNLGKLTKTQVRKLRFVDVENELRTASSTLQRAELVKVRGFVQLKARRFRKGKTIRAKKRR